eukprot:CAMPEP_0205801636 /NCGR_PEP_ID=MMETSP0205-20121125/3672_1 /ASSEMBLY_ACC=CAM_ASM_000278 /TAXON_ID=36767 /ORGANISM="Euplotes focardii, Strain TN1" /LENGTH=54 /DNA_ID=CAMNT_0053066677 /DNA_START=25 /DNA_END=189 /DNA_ORIENTATION=+
MICAKANLKIMQDLALVFFLDQTVANILEIGETTLKKVTGSITKIEEFDMKVNT